MITTRIPGEPEPYLGRYQTSHASADFRAACPACGSDCTWTATPTSSTPTCGCTPDLKDAS